MSSSHRIITTGTTLVLSPTLSQHFGDSAALVLQQLHYWLSKENISYGVIDANGCQWIRNSYNQWQKQIQVRSLSTIRLAFSYLEQENIINAQNFDEGNEYPGGSQVKYYTINYDQLESVIGDLGKARINRPSHLSVNKLEQTRRAGNTSLALSTYKSQNTFSSRGQCHDENHYNNSFQQPTTLLKISTPPAQNEHPLIYITKTTSENTSLSGNSEQIETHQKHLAEGQIHMPAKPAERDKLTISKEMISLWNEIVEQNKNEITLNNKRSQHLNAAFKQFFNCNLAHWEAFCCKIASSKFLMGEVTYFKANLDWSLRFEKIQSILEGAYSFGDRVVNYKPKLNKTNDRVAENAIKRSPEGTIKLTTLLEDELPKATILREIIQQSVGDTNYCSWFEKTKIYFEKCETGQTRTVLYAPSTFVRDRLRTHFRDLMEKHFYDIRVGEPPEQQKENEISFITKAGVTPIEFLLCPKNSTDDRVCGILKSDNVQSDVSKLVPVHMVSERMEYSKIIDECKIDNKEVIQINKISNPINEINSINNVKYADVNIHEGRAVIKVSSSLTKKNIQLNTSEIIDEFIEDIPILSQHIKSVEVDEAITRIHPRLNDRVNSKQAKKTSPKMKTQKDNSTRSANQAILDVDDPTVPTIFYSLIKFGDRSLYSYKDARYKRNVLKEAQRAFKEVDCDTALGFTPRKIVLGVNVFLH